MTPLDILKAARETLSDPKRWTRGAYGRDADGVAVNCAGQDACCFCSAGATIRAASSLEGAVFLPAGNDAMGAIRALTPRGNIPEWNDNPLTTHEEVLRVFDAAIAEMSA